MTFEEAFNEYERLKAAYEAGEIDAGAFDAAVSRLQVTGPEGRRWRIGTLTGDWYRSEGGRWVADNPQHPAPLPKVPPLIRLFLPGIAAMGCVVLIFLGVAAFALFERPVNTVIAYALGRVTPVAAQFTATATPTQTATATETATPTATVTATRLPTRTPTRTPTLSPTPLPTLIAVAPNGPWLMVASADGLWAAAPDGSVVTQVETSSILAPGGFSRGAAPTGGHMAYIRDDGSAQLELRILQLPELKVVVSIPLLSKDVQAQMTSAKPPAGLAEGLRAISEQNNLAWSPDGRTLAFTGMRDQPAADLYLYSLDTDKITRAEVLPSHAYNPNWSPDGRFLIYFSASSFGKGSSGIQMDGAWELDYDQGKVRQLYDPTGQGEILVGWEQPHTFLVYAWDPACQATNLRLIDAETRSVTWVLQRCFTSAAQDPETGNVLISIQPAIAEACACSTSKVEPGIYYLPSGMGLPQHIHPQAVDRITWDEGTRLFLAGSKTYWDTAFDSEGGPASLPFELVESLPVVSRVSGLQAWIKPGVQPGLWVGSEGEKLRHVYDGFVLNPLWGPEGNLLFFFSDEQLWKAAAPDFVPQSIIKFPGPVLGATWVEP